MLILNRRAGEGLYIYPDYSKVSPSVTLGELFGDNAHIIISLEQLKGKNAKVGIEAPEQFAILRSELEDEF